MEFIFELFFQFLIEVIGQIFFELLVEFGLRSIGSATGAEKPKNPVLSTIGYVVLAAIGAGVSLFFFPAHFIRNEFLRLINLVLSPLVVGFLMANRRKILLRKSKTPIQLDSFAYGFLFAFVFSLSRFLFAK